MKHLPTGLIFFLISFALISSNAFGQSVKQQNELAFLQLSEEATIADTLSQYAQRANKLWSEKSSKLNFAANFLSVVSRTQAENYYQPASVYYFWSIKNADFTSEKEAITAEVNRLLPLITDSVQKQWNQYLEQEDRQLFNEIIGFWRIHDPYSSTKINERLIEHWKRIHYSRTNFKRNNSSVYGTDDRGVIYIRMGPPNRIVNKSIFLSGVIDPVDGRFIDFELGNVIQSELQFWEYKIDGESYIYLFGRKNGTGKFRLQTDLIDVIDNQGLLIAISGGGFLPPGILRRVSKNVVRFGLYQQLAPLHPSFDRIFQELRTSILNNSFQTFIQRYQNLSYIGDSFIHQLFYKQSIEAPRNRTTLRYENELLTTRSKIFRFLDNNNKNEYLFSVEADPDKEIETYNSHFLSNKLFVYNKDWDLLENIDDLKKVDERTINNASTYKISVSALAGNQIYFSSELIDTTRKNIILPGKINSQTSAIVSSTGKERINFPEPLPKTDSFSISDVIVGNAQEENFEARLPITPSLEYTFKKDSDIMIYFEAYNIPKGGYSFNYFFKKDRWLLSNKKIERTEITVLADKTEDRDSQLFSINPDDLEPGKYELIFQFKLLNNPSEQQTIEKKIEIEITK